MMPKKMEYYEGNHRKNSKLASKLPTASTTLEPYINKQWKQNNSR